MNLLHPISCQNKDVKLLMFSPKNVCSNAKAVTQSGSQILSGDIKDVSGCQEDENEIKGKVQRMRAAFMKNCGKLLRFQFSLNFPATWTKTFFFRN